MPFNRGRSRKEEIAESDRFWTKANKEADISRFGNFSTQHRWDKKRHIVMYTPPDLPMRRHAVFDKNSVATQHHTEPAAAEEARAYHEGTREGYIVANEYERKNKDNETTEVGPEGVLRVDNGREPGVNSWNPKPEGWEVKLQDD